MKFWNLALASTTLVLSVSANAALIGDTVYAQISTSNGNTFFNSSEVIGSGVEFVESNYPAPLYELDLFDTYALFRITNNYWTGLSIMGNQQLVISGFDDFITGVNATQTKTGLSSSSNPDFSVIFNDHSITFDLLGTLSFTNSQVVKEWRIDINTTTAPVPSPAAFWLFGSGLIGLIGLAKGKANA